jgi:hypothetical protein
VPVDDSTGRFPRLTLVSDAVDVAGSPAGSDGIAPAGEARSRRQTVVRFIRHEVLPGWDTPVTSFVLLALVVTTVVLQWGVPGDVTVQRWASTNLVNLRGHPVAAMFASIVVTSGPGAAVGIVLALTGPALERRAGHLRALLIPFIAHTAATLASEGGLRAAIWAHSSARSQAFQLDIGTSYVAYAAWGALMRYVPRRWRLLYGVVLAGCTLIPLAIMRDMIGWGHLLSAVIGLLSWHWLPDQAPHDRRPAPFHRRRWRFLLPKGAAASASRWTAVTLVTAMTVTGSVLLYAGQRLLPDDAHPADTGTCTRLAAGERQFDTCRALATRPRATQRTAQGA